jgi:hypothetical protein
MRITGNDHEGQAELGNFMDPESTYPVLVTTSRLLSTGVDVQTCRLIVLDREVGSMTEFKQIVGRGTRVHEDTRKFYFTLMDFRGASSHFADPDFDGEPVQIYEPGEDEPVSPPDDVPPATLAAILSRSPRTKVKSSSMARGTSISQPSAASGRRSTSTASAPRSLPSGWNTWTSTASWSPRACVTSPRRPSGSTSPAWMIS